jgi:GFO/IDH/MocA oxidoreductase family protein
MEQMMGELRLGMVGIDTSHCPAFTKLINETDNEHHVPGGRLVCAFAGGSQAFSKSYERVDKYTAELRDELGIEIKDSIEAVAESVDAILLESCDGRQHLEQFDKIAPAGLPVFIDKPLATTAAEAKAIVSLSEKHDSPILSCSSLRYNSGIEPLAAGKKVLGCEAFGPSPILDDFPGHFWYGIHTAEILFSKMGCGCREVVVQRTDTADVVTGVWDDGRAGTMYAYDFPDDAKCNDFGCTVFAEGGVEQGVSVGTPPAYALMLQKVMAFFQTREAPINPQETVEITAFLEAANQSRETGEAVRLGV